LFFAFVFSSASSSFLSPFSVFLALFRSPLLTTVVDGTVDANFGDNLDTFDVTFDATFDDSTFKIVDSFVSTGCIVLPCSVFVRVGFLSTKYRQPVVPDPAET
jgi:hypothetical protein